MKSNQEFTGRYSLQNKSLKDRYDNTIRFLKKSVNPPTKILDLGIHSLLSELMIQNNYIVTNTEKGIDLDEAYSNIDTTGYDLVTAFEIFEHLVAPYNILKEIKAPQLIASIPLKLWFAPAYWNDNDPWDRHYHEFEPRQFDMLLEKSGWKIISSEKWISKSYKIGLRPLLRRFNPRYYIVHCVRK